MKKFIVLGLVLLSTLASASELKHLNDFTVGEDNVEALRLLDQDLETEGKANKYYGFWECEAQAADGAGGIGRGQTRAQAASMAMNYCRMYSVAPYTCGVVSCFRL